MSKKKTPILYSVISKPNMQWGEMTIEEAIQWLLEGEDL